MVTVTVGSTATIQSMQRVARQLEKVEGTRTAPPPGGGTQSMTTRERLNQYKRTREGPGPPTEDRRTAVKASNLEIENCEKLAELRRRYPGRMHLREPTTAVKMTLRQRAAGAARLRDLDVRVAKIAANGRECP